MTRPALTPRELELIATVLQRHPEVISATLFGSRAKGTHTECSDVDLAVVGEVSVIRAESIAAELDELPLPCQFEVVPLALIKLEALREHIERVGIPIYPAKPAPIPD